MNMRSTLRPRHRGAVETRTPSSVLIVGVVPRALAGALLLAACTGPIDLPTRALSPEVSSQTPTHASPSSPISSSSAGDLSPSALPDDVVRDIDLSDALLTIDDLPEASRVRLANEDYVASGVPRLILCGDDIRRDLGALSGRFALFYGPPDEFLWLSPAVSGLSRDNATTLVDRIGEVAAGCERTWRGEGYEGADTEFEVLDLIDMPSLGEQRVAVEIAHRSAAYPDARLYLVYIRRAQFVSALLVILDHGSDPDVVLRIAGIADEKLAAALAVP